MRPMQKTLAALVFGVVVASLSLVPALAGESPRPENPVAQVNVGPTSVAWSPAVDYERLVLTVVGPEGFENRQELEAGQSPSLTLFKPNGERLADGVYRYELRLLPRTVAGTKNLTDKAVQTGGLWVRGGAFVTPTPEKNPVASPPSSKRPQARNITEKDSVVSDDLVVQGTACIGPYCVNGDPDATNTLKLKSRLPRILFVDPFSGFFPARDWALQGNTADPLDYFILQDVTSATVPFSIHGGSPNDTLVVASGGFDAQERRVGIGTSLPLKNLHVTNATTPTIRLEQPVSPGPARIWDVGASNTQFFVSDITASSSVPFKILAGAPSNSLVVTSTGNIGIGTSSPTAKLHLFDNTDVFTVFTIENSSSGGNAVATMHAVSNTATAFLSAHGSGRTISRFGQTLASWSELLHVNGNGLIIGTLADKPLILGTNSVNRIQVTASGDVGIGTTAPSSKLHVNGGDIRVSGGSFIDDGVTLNAPDYVFDPSYSLMPLAQLRDFVSREKHLPNVPTAADIKKQGLDLSKFQMRLLEKVEELALYTLAQEEHVRSLSDENQALKARLDALERTLASAEPK